MDEPRDFRLPAPPGGGQILQFPAGGAARPRAVTDASAAQWSGSELFATLWHATADILGTAAAATLLRRAAQQAATTFPELSALEVARVNLEFQYKVPVVWNQPAAEPPEALFLLVAELWRLLKELTGSVVINHLAQVAELRESGLIPPRELRS
jgi:hypothetical protein